MVKLAGADGRCLASAGITSDQRVLAGILLSADAQRSIIGGWYQINCSIDDVELSGAFIQTHLETHGSIGTAIISGTPFNIKDAVRRDPTDGRKDAIAGTCIAVATGDVKGTKIRPVREDCISGGSLWNATGTKTIVYRAESKVAVGADSYVRER